MLGKIEGRRRRGQQSMRWFNGITDSMDMSLNMSNSFDPMDYTMPGFQVYHQPLEFTQTHVHKVSDALQQSNPLLTTSPAFYLSQYQGLSQ